MGGTLKCSGATSRLQWQPGKYSRRVVYFTRSACFVCAGSDT